VNPALPPSNRNAAQPLSRVGGIRRTPGTLGFSLVEIALAIGIIAFAFVAMFSLLPVGMNIFREAMDTSISAQIVQRIVGDAEETDFDTLKDDPANSKSGFFYALPLRYFDDQGSEVKVQNPASPSASERLKILYTVRVRGTLPGNSDPATHTSNYPTSLPSKGANRFNPRDDTFLTIQIAKNPALKDLTSLVSASTYLIDPVSARAASIPVQTYSVVVVRNR
jgi:uncharacterized protein (TIGR02598 family)